ncbi:MAG: hypothetical protein HUJ63_02465 [Enterococcus sp.]|nr:hypothetical protein [Enterococcus sp.]
MKGILVSIKDELSGFVPPYWTGSEMEAKRDFMTKIDNTPLMRNHKKDFSVWKVGEYDTDTGEITETNVKLIMRGEDYAERSNE